MALSFYILVGFLKTNRKSNEAALKYFLLGSFSTGIFLYGHLPGLRDDPDHAARAHRASRAPRWRCSRPRRRSSSWG